MPTVTLQQFHRRAEIALEIQRMRQEADAFTRATIAAIRERDNDNKFLKSMGILPISEAV